MAKVQNVSTTANINSLRRIETCMDMTFIGYTQPSVHRNLTAFYRAMRCTSAVFAVMQCLSVCLSVTFVDHVKTNKHIFEIFSPSGSDTILVFPYQRGCRYSDGNPPNGGVECKGV